MSSALHTSIQLGLLYGIATLAIVVSFRFLRFPDLTVDGSFVLGAVVAAVSIHGGITPFSAIFLASATGFLAGICTAALHRLLGINRFFAGILTMMMLYSVNLRILGGANFSLLDKATVFTSVTPSDSSKSLIATLSFFIFGIVVVTGFFTRTGLRIRALGSNAAALPISETHGTLLTCVALGFANALAAVSGSLVAQYQRFADVGMGIGVTVNVFAALFLGEGLLVAVMSIGKLFRKRKNHAGSRFLSGGGVIVGEACAAGIGTVAFMGIVTATLYWGLRPSDTKFFGALLLLSGLVWRRASKPSFLVAPGEFER